MIVDRTRRLARRDPHIAGARVGGHPRRGRRRWGADLPNRSDAADRLGPEWDVGYFVLSSETLVGVRETVEPASSQRYAALAHEALADELPGWAFICFEAAADHADREVDLTAAASARQRAQQVLDQHFPPFSSDAECLATVSVWAVLRAEELRRRAPGEHPFATAAATLAAKHRWMFRLVQTVRLGRSFRLDTLFLRFQLEARERAVLRTLLAIAWNTAFHDARYGRALTVGDLVYLLADDEGDRARWIDVCGGSNTILRQALMQVSGPGTLRVCTIAPDESVFAWVEGRRHWPPELARTARLHPAAASPPSPEREDIAAFLRRATALHGAPRIALRVPSTRTLRAVVEAWSGLVQRPWIEVLHGRLSSSQLQLLDREACLHDALVVFPPQVPDESATSIHHFRADVCFATFGAGIPARSVDRVTRLEVVPPAPAERPALWNRALVAFGYPELHPLELDHHVGDLPLDGADIEEAVRITAMQLYIEGRPEQRVTPSILREAAMRLLADQSEG